VQRDSTKRLRIFAWRGWGRGLRRGWRGRISVHGRGRGGGLCRRRRGLRCGVGGRRRRVGGLYWWGCGLRWLWKGLCVCVCVCVCVRLRSRAPLSLAVTRCLSLNYYSTTHNYFSTATTLFTTHSSIHLLHVSHVQRAMFSSHVQPKLLLNAACCMLAIFKTPTLFTTHLLHVSHAHCLHGRRTAHGLCRHSQKSVLTCIYKRKPE
jgi:hypothetical protein